MSEGNYDDYDRAIAFEGDFEGEPTITRALFYSDGNIQIHQGPRTGDNEFRPDDIIGINRSELEEIYEKAEEVVEGDTQSK